MARICVIAVWIGAGGWGGEFQTLPSTVPEFRQYVKGLVASELIPKYVFDLFDWLEEHEDEMRPWSNSYKAGPLSHISYSSLDGKNGRATLPSNWVAVGDAILKLNPVYGEQIPLPRDHSRGMTGTVC